MAINNKDGSVYRLRGPNPLMRSQQEWDRNQLHLINMGCHHSEVVEDRRNPVEQFKKDYNVIDIGEDLDLFEGPEPPQTQVLKAKELIDEINEEPDLKPEHPKESTITLNVDSKLARMLRERGAQYFCAPVSGTKFHTDQLYGTNYKTYQYGSKFLFDAIIIDQSDLELQIWSVKLIPVGSILYKKIREGGERWWRVKETEPKTGGHLSLCGVSETNPDFS
jgi:hypothetical protein